MSKQCFKCLKTKPLTEFYKHPQMGDGHLGKCKSCTKLDVSERESRLRETDPEWLSKERARCRNKQALARFLGKDCKTNPAVKRQWEDRNKHKKRANIIVNNAVRDGRLHKPKHCNRCGKQARLHGHHEDYSMPLLVEWLCPQCHGLTWRK